MSLTTVDGSRMATGSFDNVGLFGRFMVRGAPRAECAQGAECLHFRGTISFGDGDGSGFPNGTRTDFTLSLVVTGSGATGVYRIGVLPSIDGEQYGTVTLSRAP